MQPYAVHVRRDDQQHVAATTRQFSLTLGARRADATAGFNPVDTLCKRQIVPTFHSARLRCILGLTHRLKE